MGSFKFYFDLLFDYPFGGVEDQNVRIIMEFISEEYDGMRPTRSPEETVAWLKAFHTALGRAGQTVLDPVPGLGRKRVSSRSARARGQAAR